MVDHLPLLKPALAFLKCRAASPDAALWSFPRGDLVEVLRAHGNALGLQEINVSLYSLRHGGASRDLLKKYRTLKEIKLRGRWASDSSLRRYSKETKLVDILSRVPPSTLRLGEWLDERLPAVVRQCAPRQRRSSSDASCESLPP